LCSVSAYHAFTFVLKLKVKAMKTTFQPTSTDGYFGIGIFKGKTIENLGTLWRSADLFGAKFIFTIGGRYKKQSSDTSLAYRNIPLYNYETFEEFYKTMPYNCLLVGIEMDKNSESIQTFTHPQRCIYLLGSEDYGLSNEALSKCHQLVQLPGRFSFNVAVAGSLVMFDRFTKKL
jgi:tRNA G18 (ribose-2'-O)-methylase SpoU